jgi:murein DD-endopeptidase MepM/ murein hydrolase activator NlpD
VSSPPYLPWAAGATGGNLALMQEEVSAQEALRQEELLRRKNRRAAVYRQRRIRLAVAFAAVGLVALGIIIAVAANRSTTQVDANARLAGGARSPSAPVAAGAGDYPAFARLGDRNLLLPVKADDATIVAYQPVSDERVVSLTPIGEKANANALIRFFRGIFSTEPSVRYYQLEGGAGEPTSSVLVGAAAGSPIYAPISGVVTRVHPYKLFGKYDDVQIDIRPEKMGGFTVSLLFVSDPAVSIGEIVTAGKTVLGAVRQCPETLGASLSEYTHDSGAHVHLQVVGEPIN